MAATITSVSPGYGKAADAITIIGTGFTDAPESLVWVRKSGESTWQSVNATRVAFVSATELTLTLDATEFDEGGLWDIGVSDSGDTAPDDYLEQAVYFYVEGSFNPDAVVKGAPYALYVDGRLVGHCHGAFELEYEIETSDIEVNESLVPVRTIKTGETITLSVPLAELSLENLRDVWGISATIQELDTDRRRLTFGGDVDLRECEVMVVLPWQSGKRVALVLYRCSIVAPGTLSWSRDEQVDLPLRVTVLADTSRPVGDQIGYWEEYATA